MDFRDRLREEIEFSGLSNKEVALKAGITSRAMVSYVSSQACMPSADVAVRLAKALNTTVEYLVGGIAPHEKSSKERADSRRLLSIWKSLSESKKRLLLALAEDVAAWTGTEQGPSHPEF